MTQTIDVSTLSDADAFAYFKRTAPVEDIKFQLRLTTLPEDIQLAYTTLLADLDETRKGKATPATKREYLRLQQMTRERFMTYSGKPANVNWTIYYRNAKGRIVDRNGNKMDLASFQSPCIIRPLEDKGTRETQPNTIAPQVDVPQSAPVTPTVAKTSTSRKAEQPVRKPQAVAKPCPGPRTHCSKCGTLCSPEEFGARTDCRACRQAYRRHRAA